MKKDYLLHQKHNQWDCFGESWKCRLYSQMSIYVFMCWVALSCSDKGSSSLSSLTFFFKASSVYHLEKNHKTRVEVFAVTKRKCLSRSHNVDIELLLHRFWIILMASLLVFHTFSMSCHIYLQPSFPLTAQTLSETGLLLELKKHLLSHYPQTNKSIVI